MMNSQKEFSEFIQLYEAKVRAKFSKANNRDDQLDVFTEIEAAYMFMDSLGFTLEKIEYEKYREGPDFTLTLKNGLSFNAEVKRIREWDIEQGYNHFKNYLRSRLKKENLCINLSLNLKSWPVPDRLPALLLDDDFGESTYQHIKRRIVAVGKGQRLIFDAPDAEELSISILHPEKEDAIINVVSWGISLWGLVPEATKKVRNDLLTKQDQLITGCANVLVLRTWNMYMMGDEFSGVLYEFEKDEEYAEKINKTSAVIYKGSFTDWSTWENPKALVRLPDFIIDNLPKSID